MIADEPTAPLDPTTEQEILSLFRTLQRQFKPTMILITHKPAVLAGLADRVLVLYAGRVAELGPTETVLGSPQHPYTRALLRCLPPPIESHANGSKTKLPVIAGDARNLALLASGCQFEPRCTERMDICTKSEPAKMELSAALLGRSKNSHRGGRKMKLPGRFTKWLVLGPLHGVVPCAGFFAPYDPGEQDRENPYLPALAIVPFFLGYLGLASALQEGAEAYKIEETRLRGV